MLTALKRLVSEEKGQGMAEYGLILALVAVAAIAGLVILGPAIKSKLSAVGDELNKTRE